MKLLKSPLSMTPAKSGNFEITTETRPAGYKFNVVSMRQAFLEGKRQQDVVYDSPVTIHALRDGNGLIMSDAPIELAMMSDFIKKARGRVLIGGLGLSLVTRIVAARPHVNHVTVVEIEKDVIHLTGSDLDPGRVTVVHDDLFTFLRRTDKWIWQTAFFDIWNPTGERTWAHYVAPLRRIVQNRFGTRSVCCWGEPEMIGQMIRSLSHNTEAPLGNSAWSPAHYAFRKATIDRYPAPLHYTFNAEALIRSEHLAQTDPYFREMLRLFLFKVGTKRWEKTFGRFWDEKEEAHETADGLDSSR